MDLTASAHSALLRPFDLALTLVIMPLALLLGGVIALAIIVDSPGPIFYRCRRVGHRWRPFSMLKFRKMRHQAEGPRLTTFDDERFTPIGKLLAATRLDELPQLWNVLTGDMRLVGPRPEVDDFVSVYPEQYRTILSVVPGLTGPAQLEFFQESRVFGNAHDSAAFYAASILPRKIELDLRYVRQRTVRGDLSILLRTLLLPARAFFRVAKLRARRIPTARMAIHLALACSVLTMVGVYASQA